MKNLLFRDAALDTRTLNKDSREITLSFSSETPVMRYGEAEILLHAPENVDLARLQTMGAALFNHEPDAIVGAVTAASVEGKRGLATIKFDDTDEGERAFKRVQSGSLRGVSVGYRIDAYTEIRAGAEAQGIKGPAMLATRWTPYEISLTPVPADASVGVGRDIFQRALETAEKTVIERIDDMTPDEVKALARAVVDEALAQRDAEAKAKEESAKPAETPMTPEIMRGLKDMAAAHSPEMVVRVAEMVLEGRTEDEIKAEIAKPKPDAVDNPGAGNPAERAAVTITAEQFVAAWKKR